MFRTQILFGLAPGFLWTPVFQQRGLHHGFSLSFKRMVSKTKHTWKWDEMEKNLSKPNLGHLKKILLNPTSLPFIACFCFCCFIWAFELSKIRGSWAGGCRGFNLRARYVSGAGQGARNGDLDGFVWKDLVSDVPSRRFVYFFF